MASNVYTKNEILQNLASKGYFVDAYTLDTFFKKWKIEAIFEDEQGSEFYDKNALDMVLNNLFNTDSDEEEDKKEEENYRTIEPKAQTIQEPQQAPQNDFIIETTPLKIDDKEANDILNNIALSDGTTLSSKLQDDIQLDPYFDYNMSNIAQETNFAPQEKMPEINNIQPQKEKKLGILEGAMQATGKEFLPEPSINQIEESSQSNDENSDFDDISLLSESLEAQEKFREYVMSEFSKKSDNMPKSNEFKLDISERTLSMIARSMAKKIAKHVNSLCAVDSKNGAQLAEIQEKNKKLEQKTKELEDQNKKLRLLLAESNKNLNSYKPSIFGLYKKVPPGK